VATKSGQQEPEKAEVVEELLDALDTALDRVKVLYEQYFLGIQKQPPTYLHTDVERKIRDLAQLQVRNTALRYRFATLQQKFGSYNAYWRRTLRQIENGTYTRSLSKIGRQAARTGATVPEEILAAMPKRMREQVKRDREAALALAALRPGASGEGDLLTLAEQDGDVDDFDPAAFVHESTELRRNALTAGGAHKLDESDAEFDVDAFFAAVTSEAEPPPQEAPGQAAGTAPAAPASGQLDAPVIRWRAPASQGEPSPPQDARPAARRTGHPRPGSASGAQQAAASADPTRSVAPVAPSVVPVAPSVVPVAPSVVAVAPSVVAVAPSVVPVAPSVVAVTPSVVPVAPVGPRPVPSSVVPVAPSVVPVVPVGPRPVPPSVVPVVPSVVPVAPVGPRSVPPRVVIPPVGVTASPPVPRISVVPPMKPVAPGLVKPAPSQATHPIPVAPGASAARAPSPVETLAGPFPRLPSLPPLPNKVRPAPGEPPAAVVPPSPAEHAPPTQPADLAPPASAALAPAAPAQERAASGERPPQHPPVPPERASAPPRVPVIERPPQRPPAPRARPGERRPTDARPGLPPGMTDADVDELYAKYVKAKQTLGEEAGPGAYGKLIKTINVQAPKIMEQYHSKGVDFSVIVKDNQVIIRAKPKP
jgi:hypothetical protein